MPTLVQRLVRGTVVAAVVAAARGMRWLARLADLGRVTHGVEVFDLGPADDADIADADAGAPAPAASVRVDEALAVLRARSPRTLGRLRRAAPSVHLQAHRAESVGFDPATGSINLGRAAVARLSAEQVAVLLGVGAVLARFGWANFRPSPDVRAQVHRRVGREAEALLDELGACYPTREWYARWRRRLPASEATCEAALRAEEAEAGLPPWAARVRAYLWR